MEFWEMVQTLNFFELIGLGLGAIAMGWVMSGFKMPGDFGKKK